MQKHNTNQKKRKKKKTKQRKNDMCCLFSLVVQYAAIYPVWVYDPCKEIAWKLQIDVQKANGVEFPNTVRHALNWDTPDP